MEITITNAMKTIGKVCVLDSVSLTLHSGMVYGLQGPNGSGKTMLMRLVSGLIHPTTGTVWIDDKELGKDIDFPASMGLLLENPAFLPGYTGRKNLELLAAIRNTISHEEICQALIDVGLDPNDVRKYRKYSLGMKQRLGFAAAIMEKPQLIILDEPTNALDSAGVEQICALIRRERERGALILLSCHSESTLYEMSDAIFTVVEGKVVKRL